MWYKVEWSVASAREQKFTELIFSYEDELANALSIKLDVSKNNLVIHEIEKYTMKEGTA